MIDYELLNDISEYARKHLDSSYKHYSNRAVSSSRTKIYQDILKGKIAEFNLYFHLIEKGYRLDPPCLKVYQNKTYDSDLYIPNKNTHIHVKSVSIKSYKRFGLSVTFQKNDPLIILPQSNHWICIMREIDFLSYSPSKWVNSLDADYKPTKLRHPSKLALYY